MNTELSGNTSDHKESHSLDDLEKRLMAIDEYEHAGGLGNLCVAAELLLDTCNEYDNDRYFVQQNLDRAEYDLQYIQLNTSPNRSENPSAWAFSSMLHIMFPQYRQLLLEEGSVSKSVQKNTYSQLVAFSMQLSHLRVNQVNTQEKTNLLGIASELNVLLLLQRQSVKMVGTDWFPLPAFWSQDRRGYNKNGNNSWDISVFNRLTPSEKMKVIYKIQVKSSKKNDEKYSNDIVVVKVSNDLKISGERRFDSYCIPNESFSELYRGSSEKFTQILDQRTEQLLDILD